MKTLRSLQIMDYLRKRKHCSIRELQEHFAVSPATIYRSVEELSRKNLLQKVCGGVSLAAVPAGERECAAGPSHFLTRINRNSEKKQKIALLALREISDGNILFLDSSTTSLYLARELQKTGFSNLTIITNSVLILQEFYLFPAHFVLLSPGGSFTAQLNSFLGRTAVENLQQMKMDKVFFSAVGIQGGQATTFHEEHAGFLSRVLAMAGQSYLLLDSSKFGKSGIFPICRLSEVSRILSDKDVPSAVFE